VPCWRMICSNPQTWKLFLAKAQCRKEKLSVVEALRAIYFFNSLINLWK
jgi:hypothetical protein